MAHRCCYVSVYFLLFCAGFQLVKQFNKNNLEIVCRIKIKPYLYSIKLNNMKSLVNQNVIAELKNGLCFVRDQKNHGVITALVSERKTKKVLEVLNSSDSLTFSQIWDKMNLIKGVNFEYRSY